jgi:hypothetical protein
VKRAKSVEEVQKVKEGGRRRARHERMKDKVL